MPSPSDGSRPQMDSDPQSPERRSGTDPRRRRRPLSRQPSLSPGPSRRSSVATHATTPVAEQSGDDYFQPLGQPPSRPSSLAAVDSRPARPESTRLPSIRIRRSSLGSIRTHDGEADGYDGGSRPGSLSQPADVATPSRNPRRLLQMSLPRLTEEGTRPTLAELGLSGSPMSPVVSLPEATLRSSSHRDHEGPGEKRSRLRRVSRFFWPGFGRRQSSQAATSTAEPDQNDEYNEQLVDWLDIIDPEVQALSTLTNVQNSLFVPDLGNLVNRRPTYVLSQRDLQAIRPVSADPFVRSPEPQRESADEAGPSIEDSEQLHPTMQRSSTITSRLTESHYAALPHGSTLEGWSAAEKWELDDHVRHMLHSRRSRFKRTMKGFGQYVRRPLGFFVTLYATLITLFGLAWVLFLIGWIYVGEKQVYAIHIIDSVLVALFAIMGDGLAPFRAIDTYHMIFVVRYSRMLRKAEASPRAQLEKETTLAENPASALTRSAQAQNPQQEDQTLPQDCNEALETGVRATDESHRDDVDVQDGKSDSDTASHHPLTAKQRQGLSHHQKKLAKSHSFYKPEETLTHYSFPLGYLMAIVILLDFHSCLQISLGACTWGIDYHHRPFALTTVILCVSITCNLTAGLVIMIGDRKTRKKDVMKLLNRQELTGDAIKAIEHKRKKEQPRSQEMGSEQSGIA